MKESFKTTVGEIAKIIGGEILSGNPDTVINTISSDSREIGEDTLFIPIIGETFDGHDFIDELLSNKKISCSVTMKKGYEKSAVNSKIALILCNDTMSALGKIGKSHRDKFKPVTIGVTGTNGKTTTKELIYLALSSKYKTLKNIKNFNNEIGVPFTLLKLDESYTAAVIEMGMNHKGEIERLSVMASPDIGVITNIGAGHLEFLGSIENVAFAKSEIVKGMKPESTLIANRDTECFNIIEKIAAEHKMKLFTFGLSAEADLYPESYKLHTAKTEVTYNGKVISFPLYGKHNVYNILATLAAAHVLNINLADVSDSIARFTNVGSRSEIIDKEFTVIDDTYNSNPLSSRFAIESMCDVFPGKRKIIVLADMKELGESASLYHTKVGEFAAARKVDLCIFYGEMAKYYEKGALSAGADSRTVKIFDSKDEIVIFLKSYLKENDIVLIKGSRSMKMEDVVSKLIA